jgi:hypothetical protein
MTKILLGMVILASSLLAFSSAQAEGGCGWGFHRGPWGGCRANGGGGPGVYVGPRGGVVVAPGAGRIIYVEPGRACPYGFHLGPQGRRCWPN